MNFFNYFSAIVTADVDDVREVMIYYKQFENPIEQFKENQRKLYEQLEEQHLQEQQSKPALTKKWTPLMFSKK